MLTCYLLLTAKKSVIKFVLAEDAGDRADVTCLATVPMDMEVAAQFLAKESGIIAGIAFSEMIFYQVDHSLKLEWSKKDGDTVHNGLQFGKVSGRMGILRWTTELC